MEAVAKETDMLMLFEDQNFRGAYREYFIQKRKNFQVVIRDIPELWDCFQKIDEIWARDLDDMKTTTDRNVPIVIAMFRNSHAQFRIAFELGFSTAISEAWAIMRSCIDTGVVAHKLYREPNLIPVWLRKDQGKAEKKAYKAAFETFKEQGLFPVAYGLSELYSYYRDYSEWGVHPGVGAISMHCKIESNGNGQNWDHTYLETDPKRLVAFLFTMLKIASLIETTYFNCFDNRLKLDYKLVQMRNEFERANQHTAEVIGQIIRNETSQ
ncbi:MAG: hypothetical protein DMG65_00155 [Candidatus Angelobacter sp. Gp1-AA117]|nr:MAG: hypothetical protein DMG65_00155 [Candidatus Angelobacter sp. Gp1-AA117]